MVGLFGKRSSILIYIYTDPFLAKYFIHLFKKNLFNQILKLNIVLILFQGISAMAEGVISEPSLVQKVKDNVSFRNVFLTISTK